MDCKRIAGFVGRLMLGIVMGVGIVSTMEGYRAKLINKQIRNQKIEQNKRYIKKLNKNLEYLVYTENSYKDGIDSTRANKYYYTNVYDVSEKIKAKKVGSKGKNRAYLTVEKNKYRNSKSRKFSNSDILNKNFSGFASDFYDEKSIRLNQKLKSYQNLKEQAKKMYQEVIKTKNYKWPCTLTNYKKDAWGRDFEYIRDKDDKAKIGFSLPWDKTKKTFLSLKLPELPKGVAKQGVKKVVANYDFVYILTNNGTLYVEGDFRFPNELGGFKCPLNSKVWWECENKLVKLPLYGVKNIWTEGYYSGGYVVLEYENGDIYVTGENGGGKLGLGHKDAVKFWTKTFDNVSIKDIHITSAYSYILTDSGELYIVGKNAKGQLGLGHKNPVTTWAKTWDKGPIKSFNIGNAYSYILTESGELYVAGLNTNGQLGLGHSNEVTTWEKVGINNVEEASIGDYSYLITKSRKLYVVGQNTTGRFGFGNTKRLKEWTEVDIENVDKVNMEYNFSYVITKTGDLYLAGYNYNGVLGLGASNYQSSWKSPDIRNVKVVNIGYNSSSSILTESGELYVTGKNANGQLGLDHKNKVLTWTKINISDVEKYNISNYSYLLTKSGELYVAGVNRNGQLGLGHKNEVIKWTKSKENIKAIKNNLFRYTLMKNNEFYYDNKKLLSNVRACIFEGCRYVQDFNGTIFRTGTSKARKIVKNIKMLDYLETKYIDIDKKSTYEKLGNRQVLFISNQGPPKNGVITLPEEESNSCN